MKILDNQYILSSILIIFTISFTIWSNPSLKPHENGDTYGYINVAQNFSDPEANDLRSFGYPLLIKIAMLIDINNWKKIVIIIQILLHSISIVLINRGLLNVGYHKITSVIVSLIICIHPALLVYTNYLIAESFLGFLLVLFWYISVKILKGKNNGNYYEIIFLGLISSFCYMVKAVWILGFLTVFIPLLIFLKKKENIFYSLILITTFHFSLPLVWEFYKTEDDNKSQMKYQSMVVNINFAAIRLGLIESGKNTKLYNKIQESGYLDEAQKCNGNDNDDFRAVYHGINFKDRYDIDFTVKVLKNSFVPYTLGQLKNIYRFYSDRMHSPPAQEAFYPVPRSIIRFYISAFNGFYRPFLILFLIFGLFINLRKKSNRNIHILHYGILLYFSTVLTIFTIAPAHMIRMRVPLDFLLVIHSIAPILEILVSKKLFFSAYNQVFKYFRIIRRY